MDTLLIEHFVGLGFFMLALVSTTCYHDNLPKLRLPLFYARLKQMQERWGKMGGTLLHFLAYVLTPVFFGLVFLLGLVFQT
jgi:hypothetical protein